MDKRVRAAVTVIECAYAARVDYAALAEDLGLCLSRLEHLFKRDLGQSMREYVRRCRLIEASRLLTATDMRISEIAVSTGFLDAANFAHAFKEHFGVSARAYRIDARIERLSPSLPILTKSSRTDQEITVDGDGMP